MTFGIVVLGSLHMDIMVSGPGTPRPGETVAGDSWTLKPGGKGGNQAVEAASAGARTAMIGAIGDDDFGSALLSNLASHGVDTSHVGKRRNTGSGISVAIVDSQGDYGAVIVSGANLQLGPHDVESAHALFQGARYLLLQNEVPDTANVAACRAARQYGVKTILNAAPARAMPGALTDLVDILVVNAIEAETMGAGVVGSLRAASEAAASLLGLSDTVIVTAGAAGVSIATRAGTTRAIAGHPIEVLSTHGAGDCFIGSLAARLADGAELEEAARYANEMAADHVSSPQSVRDG